ncbi:uncharacterized protein, partial [Bombus fervidus]|uniref:uncharacterized protein n=1 Tax=Bombus fervidus TaxID=203811 RepID=UPI003AB8AC2F
YDNHPIRIRCLSTIIVFVVFIIVLAVDRAFIRRNTINENTERCIYFLVFPFFLVHRSSRSDESRVFFLLFTVTSPCPDTFSRISAYFVIVPPPSPPPPASFSSPSPPPPPPLPPYHSTTFVLCLFFFFHLQVSSPFSAQSETHLTIFYAFAYFFLPILILLSVSCYLK